MTNNIKSKSWVFLNSNFGLFMMSSIVLSFITWSYTQWTDSLEKEKALSEKSTMLSTEISYRVQVMKNYFESECAAEKLGPGTFRDIQEIYSAGSNQKAIFAENTSKDLHTLIWEESAIQKGQMKQQYVNGFHALLKFNAYLNRLLNEMDTQGLFYGQSVNYDKEISKLKQMFTSALDEIGNDWIGTQSGLVKFKGYGTHRFCPYVSKATIMGEIFVNSGKLL